MKKSNNELKRNIDLTDGSGNSIELIENRKERMRRLSRIIGTYCQQIRFAMEEN